MHLERAATLDDDVEDRVEKLRIDEVAVRADDGGVLMSVWHLGVTRYGLGAARELGA